tara:strand:- start:5600 stop:7297 length:1698 start_codon:yes stop_codon:yes gene_type:complete
LKEVTKLTIISDFNVEQLVGYFNNDTSLPEIQATGIGFGDPVGAMISVLQELSDDAQNLLIWTLPESASNSFYEARKMTPYDPVNVIKDVEIFCDIVKKLSAQVNSIFVCNWKIPVIEQGYGMLDLKEGIGLRSLIHEMNGVLYKKLSSLSNLFLLDTDLYISPYKISSQMWYLAKVPFELGVLRNLMQLVKGCIRRTLGETKKLIVCDLDDTLWGGILGDYGSDNLKLGGHDPEGEAFKDFQLVLKGLRAKGILLAIISKNTEKVALEAIISHPEMVLRLDDFAGWRINWSDKAANLSSLVKEINIGMDSVVFLDDNPSERARVKEAFPQVLVPELPQNVMDYPQFLKGLDCFDSPSVSLEDRKRTELYHAERNRKDELTRLDEKFLSLDDWLKALDLQVVVEPLLDSNKVRASQLFNKTNQMNLSTRRMNEKSLVEWAINDNIEVFVIHVSDKFGDYGLTGFASIEFEGTQACLIDFILSCRVIGKGVEKTILHIASIISQKRGAVVMTAEFIETPKNLPCLEFFKKSKMENHNSKNTFEWNLNNAYPKPENIKIQMDLNDGT